MARAELLPRIALDLEAVYVQALPASVHDVKLSPTGKPWLFFNPPEQWTLRQSKQVVEREFDQAMPQIVGLELIGWGRNDYAWFIPRGWTPAPKQNKLIGYNGEKWVEHLNKANVVAGPLVVGDAELFSGRSGVLIRDGEGWHVELGLSGTTLPAKMALDPGGESAVISFYKEQELYRFRDGQVIQLVADTRVKGDLTGLASTRYGVFTCRDGKLHLLAGGSDSEGLKEVVKKLAPLIEKLRKAKADQRDAIVSSIIELGSAAYEPVKLASEQEEDPAMRLLLKRAVLRLEPGKAGRGDKVGQKRDVTVRIDRYVPEKISFVHQIESGDVLIGVEAGRDTDVGEVLKPGLLVIPTVDEPFYIADEKVNNSALNYEILDSYKVPRHRVLQISDDTVILPGHQGTRMWRQGKGTQSWGGNPALLLDLRARTLLAEPDALLLAVDSQGRRYRAYGGTAGRYGYAGIDVISPGQPDTRKYLDLGEGLPLDTRSYSVGGLSLSAHVGVDQEGRLYAVVKDGGMKRYDGKTWSDVPGTELARATRLVLVSQGGVVAYETGNASRLIIDGQVHVAESFDALIEAEYPRFVKHFKGGTLGMTPAFGQLLVDASGNIWLRRGNNLKVFDGERWIEEDEKKIKTRKHHGKFRFMASVDGGQSIYITNMSASSRGAYYAKLSDGVITAADAPIGTPTHPAYEDAREADGTLWFAKSARVTGGYEYSAISVKPGEEPTHIAGHGSPRLMDAGGNLLLFKSDFRKPSQRQIAMARGSEVVHQLDASLLNPIGQFVSDKPGSVYALGVRGLVRYTAEEPAEHPYKYELSGFYHFERHEQFTQLLISKLGFLALSRQEQGGLYLHVLDLPIKPKPSVIEELQADMRKLLDETPPHMVREPLKKLLADHSPAVQVQALLPLVDYKLNENQAVPGNSAVIDRLGDLWEASLPHILKMLDDASAIRRASAAGVIREMWFNNQGQNHTPWMEPAGPKLAKLLTDDPSSMVRIEAARALASFDEQAAPFVEQLLAALKDDDVKLQQMAVSALSEVGPDAWLAIPILTQIVKEPGQLSRWQAAEALQAMGPAAVDAVPTLLEVAADPAAYDSKSYVGDALWWIAGLGKLEVDKKMLAKAIVNGDSGGPAYLAAELGIKDLGVAVALAESLDITSEYDNYQAYTSAEALIKLGTKSELVLDYLRELAKSDRTYARVWAAAVYAKLTGDKALAVSVLKPVLSAGANHDAYDAALRAVKLVGSDASELLSVIHPNTGDDNPWTPLNAIQARWTLGGKPDAHIKWVASELIHRSTSNYPDDAAKSLILLGPMADEQTPVIASVLQQFVPHGDYNRWHACTVLRSIGPTDNTRTALPHLKRLLDREVEPSPYNRRIAAEAIWSISRDADLVANALADTLDDRGRSYFYACKALEGMGPAASAAIERLEEATSDRNPHFRKYAKKALEAIQRPIDETLPDDEDFAAWYEALGDEDDVVAVDALWRFVHAGQPARAYLLVNTRMVTPQALEKINQTLKKLTEQIDALPGAEDQAKTHQAIQAALQEHLQALFDETGAGRVQRDGPAANNRVALSQGNYPYASLEANCRFARAMQAIDLIDKAQEADGAHE